MISYDLAHLGNHVAKSESGRLAPAALKRIKRPPVAGRDFPALCGDIGWGSEMN